MNTIGNKDTIIGGRHVPMTGSEIARRFANNRILDKELNATVDQRRLFLGADLVGPQWLGSVASEAAMLAQHAESTRGAWPGDMCYRTDLATAAKVITNNGGLLADWFLFPINSGPAGEDGSAAWTPVFANATDGERRVLHITDWTGGGGTKPPTGYIGASGIVPDIADGVDIRGASGVTGGGGGGWAGEYATSAELLADGLSIGDYAKIAGDSALFICVASPSSSGFSWRGINTVTASFAYVSYKYFRFYITESGAGVSGSIELSNVRIIAGGVSYPPNMTSNTAPSPYVASVSSAYLGSAFNAFDSNVSGTWHAALSAPPHWLGLYVGESGIAAESFTIRYDGGANRFPKAFVIEGSNTGSFTGEQVVLVTGAESSWTSGVTKTYNI